MDHFEIVHSKKNICLNDVSSLSEVESGIICPESHQTSECATLFVVCGHLCSGSEHFRYDPTSSSAYVAYPEGKELFSGSRALKAASFQF